MAIWSRPITESIGTGDAETGWWSEVDAGVVFCGKSCGVSCFGIGDMVINL